jgi:hypothetical protein
VVTDLLDVPAVDEVGAGLEDVPSALHILVKGGFKPFPRLRDVQA